MRAVGGRGKRVAVSAEGTGREGRPVVTTPKDLLIAWLRRQLEEPVRQWLDEQLARLGPKSPDRELYVAIGMAPRRLGKDDLALSEADLEQARTARPGWDPQGLSLDEAARIVFLLHAGGDGGRFALRFRQLCRTADVGELVAFYRGLPLYPGPELLEAQAGEAARTNMKGVFEALAHRNPYPMEQFGENRWNHLVLKALFVGSALHPIQGLDRRANPGLARMLRDYAHERWAAGRPVSPELWRCVGPFAIKADALSDLQRVLASGSTREQSAAALALAASSAPEAKDLLASLPDLAAAIERGEISWARLAPEA
jgi:hypothetical protein